MIIRSTRTITLSSGNEARNFRFHSLGYGRVQATYEYTDRRRAHQVARRYTVEFLNGRVEFIVARSARGGRVECFSTSTILAELLEMLSESKVEAPAVDPEKDDTASNTSTDLLDTLKTVGGMVMVNVLITPATLGIVLYNLYYGLAVRNGLDIDELFLKFFDFEEYWRENGGETLTTPYGVYMIDTKELSKKYKELANC